MTDDPRTTAELAAVARYPDCDADVTVTEGEPDVFTVRVRHDDSCPCYRAFVRTAVRTAPRQLAANDPTDTRQPVAAMPFCRSSDSVAPKGTQCSTSPSRC